MDEDKKSKMDEMQAAFERKKKLKHAKVIAEHTVAAGESLSQIALEHYGHATPPYWEYIYEANKEEIGDNPNMVREGTVLNIPELPEDMKD